MTHRSRNGGPSRPRPSQSKSKDQPRKLHHPTPTNALPINRRSTSPSRSSLPLVPTDAELLALIHVSLRDTLESPDFLPTVQRIKSLLYDRKWLEVFGNPTLLEVYAGRWVPSRALCFRELLSSLRDVRRIFLPMQGSDDVDQSDEVSENDHDVRPSAPTSRIPTQIISLGGGAGSELIAIAAIIHAAQGTTKGKGKPPPHFLWTGIDIGAWSSTLETFRSALCDEYSLNDILTSIYLQTDLLSPSQILTNTLNDSKPALITLLFTLTELLAQSRSGTIALLRTLTELCPRGCLFLAADSASDIGSFEVGTEGRKWPVWMVLDAVLLGAGGGGGGGGGGEEKRGGGASRGGQGWEVVQSEDSRWYRLPEGAGAGWPVKLENTRYWMRLFRRL